MTRSVVVLQKLEKSVNISSIYFLYNTVTSATRMVTIVEIAVMYPSPSTICACSQLARSSSTVQLAAKTFSCSCFSNRERRRLQGSVRKNHDVCCISTFAGPINCTDTAKVFDLVHQCPT